MTAFEEERAQWLSPCSAFSLSSKSGVNFLPWSASQVVQDSRLKRAGHGNLGTFLLPVCHYFLKPLETLGILFFFLILFVVYI